MNYLKRIAALTIVTCLAMSFAQGAEKKETSSSKSTKEKPDATLRLSGGSFALGIGFSWGGGTLTYKGKDYAISVDGLALGKVGISGASASGEVFGLKNLKDFPGNYNAGAAGVTVAGGRTAVALKNEKGVRILMTSTTRGFDVTVGGGGAKFKFKK